MWTTREEPPGGKRAYRRLLRKAEDRLADVNTMTAQVGPIPPAIAARNIAGSRALAVISTPAPKRRSAFAHRHPPVRP